MTIEFTRINEDVNRNPRYVCAFFHLLTEEEKKRSLYDYEGRLNKPTKYEIAVKRANRIGGRKYHNKSYGGGIVFQSYSLKELEESIKKIVAEDTAKA